MGKKSNNYSIEGYTFKYEVGSSDWIKEKIFSNTNMGWFSFFEGSNNGQPILWHFSYAGYKAIRSSRSINGVWSNKNYGDIKPAKVSKLYKIKENILVTSLVGKQTMKDINSRNNNGSSLNNYTKFAIGAAALVGYGLYKLFSSDDATPSSYSSSNSSQSYDYCGVSDTCFTFVRKEKYITIVQCTKGMYKGQERCIDYKPSKNKYSSSCDIIRVGFHYSYEKAANIACGQ